MHSFRHPRPDSPARRFARLGLLCGLLSFSPRSDAGDWPEFRGPGQNGVVVGSPALPVAWRAGAEERKNVRWHVPTEGLGWSSPVIVGDSIYLTSARRTADQPGATLSGPQALTLVRYRATDGGLVFEKKLFDQPADAPAVHGKNSHASPTVIAHTDAGSRTTRLFVHFGHQGTACVSLDGDVLWTDREHAYQPVHGNGGSPIVVGRHLILTCDGASDPCTLALDIRTGREVWRTPRDVTVERPFSFATPQAIEVDGRTQVVSPGSNIVQALDPETGKVIWFVRYEGFSLICRPVHHRGLVMISTGYMSPKLLAIDPRGTGDVTDSHVRWKVAAGVPNTPSPVPVGDQVVMVNDGGVATGIAVKDGSKLWQKRLGGNYSASPLAAGRRIYFQSEEGEGVVLDLGEDGTAPVEVARNSLPGRVFASYAVCGDDLIIRTETGLYRIGEQP
jgi:outer membrane protein assembly factor BamB